MVIVVNMRDDLQHPAVDGSLAPWDSTYTRSQFFVIFRPITIETIRQESMSTVNWSSSHCHSCNASWPDDFPTIIVRLTVSILPPIRLRGKRTLGLNQIILLHITFGKKHNSVIPITEYGAWLSTIWSTLLGLHKVDVYDSLLTTNVEPLNVAILNESVQ